MAEKLRRIAVGENVYDIQGGNLRIFYGTCSTGATAQTKVVNIADVSELETGDVFYVKMTNAQTYNGVPKLQINSLAAKNIARTGSVTASRYEWNAGEILEFVYDGTSMILVDGAIADTTYYGLTKLSNAVDSNSEETAATSKAVKTAYDAANKTMTGATATAAGESGNVPQPAAGDQGKFLRGDGTWGEGSGTVDSVNNVRPDITKNVTLTGSDIKVSSTDTTTIASALSTQSDKVDAVIVGSPVDASSLDLLKTELINIARSMYAENSYSKLLRWFCNFTGTEFVNGATYTGYLKLISASSDYLYFVWNATSNTGDVVAMGYSNGVWYLRNLSRSGDGVGIYPVSIPIAVADWREESGVYKYMFPDATIKAYMTVLESWLDDEAVQLGKVWYTVNDGSLVVNTDVIPTAAWALHVTLGTDGTDVLEDVADITQQIDDLTDEIGTLSKKVYLTIHDYNITSENNTIGSNNLITVGRLSNNGKKPLIMSLLMLTGSDAFNVCFPDNITYGNTYIDCGRINAKRVLPDVMTLKVEIQVLWIDI